MNRKYLLHAFILITLIGLVFSMCSPQSTNKKRNMYEHATRVNIDDHEMQLNTIFFNDSLNEPWLFYYGRIPYGYSAPYVQKQTLSFRENDITIREVTLSVPTTDQQTASHGSVKLQTIPIFEIGTIEGDSGLFFYAYGANYCAGTQCPEFYGIYSTSGEVLSETISFPEQILSGESLNVVCHKHGLDLNKPIESISIFKLLQTIE